MLLTPLKNEDDPGDHGDFSPTPIVVICCGKVVISIQKPSLKRE